MAIQYSYHVVYRERPGAFLHLSSTAFETSEQARADLIERLRNVGYVRRKWWQWWRWGESPLPPGVREFF